MRQEFRHNTPDQVVDYLKEAVTAVKRANVPKEYQAAAFAAAVNLVAAKQIIVEQVAPGGILTNIERNRR